MNLELLPKLLQDSYDKDALVYENDNTFLYNTEFDKDLIKDIKSKDFQVYNATYRHNYDTKATDVYLLGRGRTCGKKIFKIQNFYPYLYVDDKKGSYKTWLGREKNGLLL